MDFLMLDEVLFLKKCVGDRFRDVKLSSVQTLNFDGWEKIRLWCDSRAAEIAASPSIRACAYLAKLDGVKQVNEVLLKNSSAFKAVWKLEESVRPK